jgi:cytochrome c oxidase accessory protein FixG
VNHPGGNQEEPVRLEGFAPADDLYKRREKIFTRYVGGTFQKLRFYTGWPLLLGYLVVPWLTWGDRQAVLFDLPARQFHLLGLTIWPQDLWLLGWLLMIAAFGLFTITTLVGRLWCGYTCPQTVWTAIFMWVEQITEGQRHQRIRLDKAPWSFDKIRRRTAKHVLWLGWAFLTGLTFVGYFTPIRELTTGLLQFEVSGWAAFWTGFFTVATYVNAGWMREQVCLYMCPYARFQSAMFDKDTLIVSYDANRGEPRGSRKRGAQTTDLGDCIDCQLCVQVCPTGIDIRDGLQYECIGCAHCIDACAQVMDKMDYAPGLIKYTTENALAGKPSHILRGRSVGYALVCVVLISAFAVMLFSRTGFGFDVLRERGQLYHQQSGGVIRNDYELKIMNKTQKPGTYSINVVNPQWVTMGSAVTTDIAGGEIENLSLRLQAKNPTGGSVPVELQVCESASGTCISEKTTFFAPTPTGGQP